MEIRADHLLGRPVVALNGRRIGRIEEFHLEKDGRGWIVLGFALGPHGLLERLGLSVRAVLGLERSGYIVNWDQLTLTERGPLRLTCPVSELRGRA
jgi:sporulation protein YlmC with PRC-barrel domain